MANQRNPMIFIAASLVVIPAITGILSLVNGRAEWFAKVKNQGINIFSNDFWSVNGRTMRRNPYLVDGLDDMKSSYIYKHEKYKHLRQQYDGDSKPAAAGEAAPSGA